MFFHDFEPSQFILLTLHQIYQKANQVLVREKLMATGPTNIELPVKKRAVSWIVGVVPPHHPWKKFILSLRNLFFQVTCVIFIFQHGSLHAV